MLIIKENFKQHLEAFASEPFLPLASSLPLTEFSDFRCFHYYSVGGTSYERVLNPQIKTL